MHLTFTVPFSFLLHAHICGRYWVTLDSIALGSTTATTSSLPVVLDSGATLCYLPQDVHTAIGSSFPTARLDTSSNYYIVDCGVKNQTGTVDFTFGEKTIKVPYSDFVWDYTDTECVVGTQPSSCEYFFFLDRLLNLKTSLR